MNVANFYNREIPRRVKIFTILEPAHYPRADRHCWHSRLNPLHADDEHHGWVRWAPAMRKFRHPTSPTHRRPVSHRLSKRIYPPDGPWVPDVVTVGLAMLTPMMIREQDRHQQEVEHHHLQEIGNALCHSSDTIRPDPKP